MIGTKPVCKLKPGMRFNFVLRADTPQSAYKSNTVVISEPVHEVWHIVAENVLNGSVDWYGDPNTPVRVLSSKLGVRSRRAKLTKAQVRTIRESTLSQTQLAKKYKVSQATISNTIKGLVYRGVV